MRRIDRASWSRRRRDALPRCPLSARLGAALAGGVALVVIGTASPATADSAAVRTQPAGNAIVTKGPAQVVVLAGAPVDPLTSTIAVYAKDRKRVMTASPGLAAGDPTGLVVGVPDLDKGVYTIVWHLSGPSGVPVGDGSSAFQVDPKGAPPSIVQQPKPAPVVTPARKLVPKWLSFLFVMVFIGALATSKRRRSSASTPVSPSAPRKATTALVTSSNQSSGEKKATPTGSRRNSSSSARSERRSTSPNRSRTRSPS